MIYYNSKDTFCDGPFVKSFKLLDKVCASVLRTENTIIPVKSNYNILKRFIDRKKSFITCNHCPSGLMKYMLAGRKNCLWTPGKWLENIDKGKFISCSFSNWTISICLNCLHPLQTLHPQTLHWQSQHSSSASVLLPHCCLKESYHLTMNEQQVALQ